MADADLHVTTNDGFSIFKKHLGDGVELAMPASSIRSILEQEWSTQTDGQSAIESLFAYLPETGSDLCLTPEMLASCYRRSYLEQQQKLASPFVFETSDKEPPAIPHEIEQALGRVSRTFHQSLDDVVKSLSALLISHEELHVGSCDRFGSIETQLKQNKTSLTKYSNTVRTLCNDVDGLKARFDEEINDADLRKVTQEFKNMFDSLQDRMKGLEEQVEHLQATADSLQLGAHAHCCLLRNISPTSSRGSQPPTPIRNCSDLHLSATGSETFYVQHANPSNDTLSHPHSPLRVESEEAEISQCQVDATASQPAHHVPSTISTNLVKVTDISHPTAPAFLVLPEAESSVPVTAVLSSTSTNPVEAIETIHPSFSLQPCSSHHMTLQAGRKSMTAPFRFPAITRFISQISLLRLRPTAQDDVQDHSPDSSTMLQKRTRAALSSILCLMRSMHLYVFLIFQVIAEAWMSLLELPLRFMMVACYMTILALSQAVPRLLGHAYGFRPLLIILIALLLSILYHYHVSSTLHELQIV